MDKIAISTKMNKIAENSENKLIDKVKLLVIKTNTAGLMLQTANTNIPANKVYIQQDFILDKVFNSFYLVCEKYLTLLKN